MVNISERINEFRENCKLSNPLKYKSFSRTKPDFVYFFLMAREELYLNLILGMFRDIKGIFHAKMGSIKNRNGMDLTETEDIKKR